MFPSHGHSQRRRRLGIFVLILSLLPVSSPGASGGWRLGPDDVARTVLDRNQADPTGAAEESDETPSEETAPESEERGGETETTDVSEFSEFLPGQRYRSLLGRGDLDRFVAPLIPRSDVQRTGRRAAPTQFSQSFEGPHATCERTQRWRF